jgi:hypothetical protein
MKIGLLLGLQGWPSALFCRPQQWYFNHLGKPIRIPLPYEENQAPLRRPGLVDRIPPLCDQAFELELARDLEKLFFGSLQLLGKPNIVRCFLQYLCQIASSFDKRSRAQIGPSKLSRSKA